MAAVNDVSLTMPDQYGAQWQNIQRQQALAQALQQQSLAPIDTNNRMAGALMSKVSPFEGLAKMMQAYAGMKGMDAAKEKEQGLFDQRNQQYSTANQNLVDALTAKPATPAMPGSGSDIDPQMFDPGSAGKPAYTPGPNDLTNALLKYTSDIGQPQLGSQFAMSRAQQMMIANALTGGAAPSSAQSPMVPNQPGSSVMAGAPGTPPMQPPQQTPQSMLSLLSPQELQQSLLIDPTGKEAFAEASKRSQAAHAPVVNRGFGIGTVDSAGNYHPDAASLQQIKDTEAAKGDIGARYDTVNVTAPNGAQFPIPKNQISGIGQPAPGIAPPTPKAVQINAPSDAAAATTSTTLGTAGIPNVVSAPTLGQSTVNKAEQSGRGEGLAKLGEDIDTKAQAAQVVKARIGEMRDLTQQFTGGSLTPYKEKLGGILIGLGTDPAVVNSKLGNISSMQAFNKEALNMAFDMTRQLTSRPAATEVMLALKANPNLTLQPDASKRIMNTIEGMADYNLDRQQGAQAWREGHSQSLDGFEAYWNKTHPISKYIDTAALKAPNPQGATVKPQAAIRTYNPETGKIE